MNSDDIWSIAFAVLLVLLFILKALLGTFKTLMKSTL